MTVDPSTRHRGDDAAAASFILGMTGLLVFNLLLGPWAITLASLSLTRHTHRPLLAALGLALGLTDLLVLAAIGSMDHTLSWHIVS
ncbi:hypothetical protein A6A06_21080 [Streptomyces sp. CB02923]|uniref:hypothetical protein n=1 Tax=Streptomyces sp. CB02923 TaxID=1718985 RepID=UPI0009389397|nr:hypothetical protein [Streptomyces sp. CB02923]OKI01289.1 hypothetical protein A6A06_21080 [Streptomyces sp. CB02923]